VRDANGGQVDQCQRDGGGDETSVPCYFMCAAARGGRGGRGNGGAGGAGVGARRPTSYDGAFDTARVTRDHHQHGGDTGQLPAPSANVELVGELGLRNVYPKRSPKWVSSRDSPLWRMGCSSCAKEGGARAATMTELDT
jgi:hypothetical protein